MTKSISDVRPGAPTDAAESSGIPEEITVLPPGVSPWFTVIVPTRNEAGNVRPLLARLAVSLDGAVAEVLFVDDSTDDTDDAIRSVARNSGCAVRLLHRAADRAAGRPRRRGGGRSSPRSRHLGGGDGRRPAAPAGAGGAAGRRRPVPWPRSGRRQPLGRCGPVRRAVRWVSAGGVRAGHRQPRRRCSRAGWRGCPIRCPASSRSGWRPWT